MLVWNLWTNDRFGSCESLTKKLTFRRRHGLRKSSLIKVSIISNSFFTRNLTYPFLISKFFNCGGISDNASRHCIIRLRLKRVSSRSSSPIFSIGSMRSLMHVGSFGYVPSVRTSTAVCIEKLGSLLELYKWFIFN